MKIEGPAKALLILVGESDHWEGKPLYTAIVEEAKKMGLAGATVTRGLMGYGAHSRIHSAHILALSEDLPMAITIVDRPERIEAFIPQLDLMIEEGVALSWDVLVEIYRASP